MKMMTSKMRMKIKMRMKLMRPLNEAITLRSRTNAVVVLHFSRSQRCIVSKSPTLFATIGNT